MRIKNVFQKLFNTKLLRSSKSDKTLPHKDYMDIYRRYPSIFGDANKFKTLAEKENFADWCEAIEYMAENRINMNIIT